MPLPQWPKNSLPMRRSDLLFFALTALLFCSCARSGSSGTTLMVSIEPQRQILLALTGPDVQVTTMLKGSADPETFEPTPSARMAVDNAAVYFATGVLPFEEKLKASSAGGTAFADTSAGIDLIYGTHGDDDADDDDDDADEDSHHRHRHSADPHYWSSVTGLRAMARNMSAVLDSLMPDSAAATARRLAALETRLDSVDALVRRQLGGSSHAFAIWHPSLSFYARDYGLRQISVGVEGKESSPRRIAAAIDSARAAGVEVLFVEAGTDRQRSLAISDALGVPAVNINPLDASWEKQLTDIAKAISHE